MNNADSKARMAWGDTIESFARQATPNELRSAIALRESRLPADARSSALPAAHMAERAVNGVDFSRR